MATEESSLTDFEYRVINIPGLGGRVYNQEHHAKIAIVEYFNKLYWNRPREIDFSKHIQIRVVSRGEWKSNIREVFGLE